MNEFPKEWYWLACLFFSSWSEKSFATSPSEPSK